MARCRVVAYTLVIWSSNLLLIGRPALALPAGTPIVTVTAPATVESTSDNVTANEPQGTVSATSPDVWKINETAGNETVRDEDTLSSRSGWTSSKNSENLETMEGWLNSSVITNDVLSPYRPVEAYHRSEINTEELKRSLAKSLDNQHDNVYRIRYNERRRSPYHFYRQIILSRRNLNLQGQNETTEAKSL